MSQQVGTLDLSFKSGYDYQDEQYYLVKSDTSGSPMTIILGGANEKVIGVLQNEPEQGEAAEVRVDGTSKVVAGTPISVGDMVSCDADGKANKVEAADKWAVGIALEEASAAGDIIEILLCQGYVSTV